MSCARTVVSLDLEWHDEPLVNKLKYGTTEGKNWYFYSHFTMDLNKTSSRVFNNTIIFFLILITNTIRFFSTFTSAASDITCSNNECNKTSYSILPISTLCHWVSRYDSISFSLSIMIMSVINKSYSCCSVSHKLGSFSCPKS